MNLKKKISELRRLITIVTKFPKWKITIRATTKKGGKLHYVAVYPPVKKKE